MKTDIYKTIVIITLCFAPSFSPQSLEEMLNDPDIFVRREAIQIIIDENLKEYIPAIEEAMFSQSEPFMIYTYLKALSTLQSDGIVENTTDFIAFSDKFENMRPKEDPLEMKVKATIFLFDAGDYSTIEYVFDIVNRDKPDVNPDAIILLGRIINEVPSYSEIAKNELQLIMNNSQNETSRFNAMLFLSIYTDSQYLPDYVDKFINDEDIIVRDQALSHLFNLEYQNLKNLLLQQLSADPSEIIRAQIADSILKVYGEPSDLKAVMDYQPFEPDPDISTWMQYAINEFIPPRPEIPTAEMIQNLLQYIEELYSYGWIWSEYNYRQYLGLQERIEAAYSEGFLDGICENFNEYFALLESHLGRPHLSEEGYKFLFYHGTYIKENVKNEFGPCE